MVRLYYLLPIFRRLLLVCFPILLTVFFNATALPSEYSVKAPLATQSLLLDGTVANSGLVVVGERGHILISGDNGTSWRQADVPTRATLTGVFFIDKHLGWAVGHDQVILKTGDGGVTWKKVYSNPEAESPLLDVWFADSGKGFAIGAYGLFLETNDGGDTWDSLQISDDDWHLNHIVNSLQGRLYIAAESGMIYRSDDQGNSWLSLPSPYEGSFFGTLPLQNDELLVFGLRGNLFRSNDAGNSWSKITTNTDATLTSGCKLSDGTIIIVGLGGTILLSRDEGNSFLLIQDPERKGFSSVLQSSESTVIIIGESGVKKRNLIELNP